MEKYIAKFELILKHLEYHQDEESASKIISDLACMSTFHFHRLFSAYAGMSLFAVMKLLRLKRAAYQLAYRQELKVIDIALMAGYDSAAAFSRAFKRVFLQSPKTFRQKPNWVTWQAHYQSILTIRSKIMPKDINFQVSQVSFPETSIAVLQHRASPSLLGNSIAQFIHWRKANGLPPSKSKTFNLIYDDPSTTKPNKYRFDIACEIHTEVRENLQGVIHDVIPAGQCAKIRHQGSDDNLLPAIDYLYTQWLKKSGKALRDFPLFLERVSLYPDVSEAETITDIYLPIK